MKKIHWTPATMMEISAKEEEEKGGGGIARTSVGIVIVLRV
jgi:hypothetical protein